MSERHFIDSLEFAKQSLEIHDKIRASNLPRLKEMLFAGRGEIDYRIKGESVRRGRYSLRLMVAGSLGLQCQYCLGEVDYPVLIDALFELVVDESKLPDSDHEDDEIDYLVADPQLDVEALIEEELLLSLPMAVRHEGRCSATATTRTTEKQNPFQVLEGIKTSNKL